MAEAWSVNNSFLAAMCTFILFSPRNIVIPITWKVRVKTLINLDDLYWRNCHILAPDEIYLWSMDNLTILLWFLGKLGEIWTSCRVFISWICLLRLCVVFLEKTLCSHSTSLKGTLNLEPCSIVCSISSWWKRLKEKRHKRDKKKRLDRTILIDKHAKFSQVIDHSDQSFLNADHE